VTHDVDEALTLADRILVMRAGRIAAAFQPKDHAPQALRPTLLAELGVRSHRLLSRTTRRTSKDD
jgi:sulfonate transport system ATP-binding protein